jgi:hypothetical protein
MTKPLDYQDLKYKRRRLRDALAEIVTCPLCFGVGGPVSVSRWGTSAVTFRHGCGVRFTVDYPSLDGVVNARRPKDTDARDSDD